MKKFYPEMNMTLIQELYGLGKYTANFSKLRTKINTNIFGGQIVFAKNDWTQRRINITMCYWKIDLPAPCDKCKFAN